MCLHVCFEISVCNTKVPFYLQQREGGMGRGLGRGRGGGDPVRGRGEFGGGPGRGLGRGEALGVLRKKLSLLSQLTSATWSLEKVCH